MRILMVSSFLPYPLFTGGNIRLFNILKRLSKHHEITLVCEIRENQSASDIAELKKYCTEVYTVTRKKQWTIQNILKAFFSLNSFLVVGHTLPHMKSMIEKLLLEKDYDVIDVETFYVMQNLPATDLPIVLVEHNIEYDAYKQFAQTQILPILRPLFLWDVWKMKRAEESSWHTATRIISVSQSEAAKIGHGAIAIPNGVDTKQFTYASPKLKFSRRTKKLLFIATFKWVQNINSCQYILQKLWPKVSELYPDLELWIVGKDIPDSIRNLGGKNVIFDAHADDTVKVFHDAYLLLFPAFIVAGTSLKVVEAMSSGLPIVTTTLGTRGLTVENEKDIMIGNTEKELIEAISRLVSDSVLYTHIAAHAREYVEKYFDWESLVRIQEKIFSEVEK